ncbi:hypothetical protein ACFWRZ_09120 [Streptomyces rubiginosohelvolus]|uniref:hypothetical protein n=1 Tax=Streptomyces rubiginosohelvolus TaxID=67362 RepID=UPI0036499CDD
MSSPTLPFTAAAVLDAARSVLGSGWMTFPAHNGRIEGSVRSHRGHSVELCGAQHGFLYTRASLPDGTLNDRATAPLAQTAAAYGTALANVITEDHAPAHDARSASHMHVAKLRAALEHELTTHWESGAATTTWALPGGGRGRHHTRRRAWDDGDVSSTRGVESWLRLNALSADEAVTVLRAINTDTRDERRRAPVHGELAQQIKAAAPGLRPIDTHNWPLRGGKCTTSLGIDSVVRVELHYGGRPGPVNIVVTGSVDNQLRAARAV